VRVIFVHYFSEDIIKVYWAWLHYSHRIMIWTYLNPHFLRLLYMKYQNSVTCDSQEDVWSHIPLLSIDLCWDWTPDHGSIHGSKVMIWTNLNALVLKKASYKVSMLCDQHSTRRSFKSYTHICPCWNLTMVPFITQSYDSWFELSEAAMS